jgi:hypothetical protein
MLSPGNRPHDLAYLYENNYSNNDHSSTEIQKNLQLHNIKTTDLDSPVVQSVARHNDWATLACTL